MQLGEVLLCLVLSGIFQALSCFYGLERLGFLSVFLWAPLTCASEGAWSAAGGSRADAYILRRAGAEALFWPLSKVSLGLLGQ